MDFRDLVQKLYEIEPSDISVSKMTHASAPVREPIVAETNYMMESAEIAKGSLKNIGIPSDLDAFLQIAGVTPSKKSINTTPIQINEDAYTSINNPPDKVSMDIPLLIRLLEFAREDAEDDIIIHDIAERMINLSISGKILSMDDYSSIIPSERGKMDKEHRLKDLEKQKSKKTDESIAEYLRKAYEAFETKQSKRK